MSSTASTCRWQVVQQAYIEGLRVAQLIQYGVAVLAKDMPFPARRVWRPTASRLAEPIDIALLDHE